MINVNNIYKNFGKVEVLKGVSCTINKGEKVVIIGASGSGKSTLLRCMNLLETPTYGEVWLEDFLLTAVDPYLHPEIIRLSKTYKRILQEKQATCKEEPDNEALDSEIIREIKANDLLKTSEGKDFRHAVKQLYKRSRLNVNLARQKVGMVFQHFNLFNNLTVLKNLTLAPVKLKLQSKQEAEKKRNEFA